MHGMCWAPCRSGGHAWPLASAGAGAGSGSVHSQRPTAFVHSQRANRMRAQRAVPSPLLVAPFLVAGHGVRGVWRLGVGCAQGLLCHWRIRGGGQPFCGRCVLARPIVLGPGRKKSQGPGFGVEDRLPHQKPPTLGVQGAPPAPRTTVSGAARSDLTCVLRPLRVRGGCHGSQARKEPPAEGENGDARAGAEHARVGCAAVHPRWESGGLIAATPSGRAQKACAGPRLGCRSWMGGGGRARGAFRADGAIPMGTRVTARATQCGTGSRAVGLQRVTVRRVGDSTPMARPHEGEEGQHVLWRSADAQPNSGSGAMSTRAATPGCSGEGAMTSSYGTLYVRIHGVTGQCR